MTNLDYLIAIISAVISAFAILVALVAYFIHGDFELATIALLLSIAFKQMLIVHYVKESKG
jgi:hypothetical protein